MCGLAIGDRLRTYFIVNAIEGSTFKYHLPVQIAISKQFKLFECVILKTSKFKRNLTKIRLLYNVTNEKHFTHSLRVFRLRYKFHMEMIM